MKYAQATPDQRQVAYTELEKIVDGLANVPKEFPTLPDKFYDKAKKEYEHENNK